MRAHGKKYNEAAKGRDIALRYEPKQAIELVKQASYAKFDETVEVATHPHLNHPLPAHPPQAGRAWEASPLEPLPDQSASRPHRASCAGLPAGAIRQAP